MSPSDEILRIRLRDGQRFAGIAASAAAGVADGLEYAARDVDRVRSVVAALCTDVVQNHFDDPADAELTLILCESHGGLSVRIEDEGLPYPVDRFELSEESLLGRRLSQGETDSLRFESRGIGGNAVELAVRRSPQHQHHLEEQPLRTDLVDSGAPIEVRPFRPEDAPSLARCVYRSYGYTYANDFIYYPDQTNALVERKLLHSYVGVNPEGEVVGHSGLLRDRPESRVAESGLGLVDPRYRSHHVFGAVKSALATHIGELGLVGYYADAVAVHAITQKINVDIGSHETGLLLGEIPRFTTFRGFEEPAQRGSVVVYYHPVGEAPDREVFLPRRYRTLLEAIYSRLSLRRSLRDVEPAAATSESSLVVELNERRGLARIEVEAAGDDLTQQVEARLRELCLRRFDVIQLDLLLADVSAANAVEELSGLGFFFACIIPELRNGDVLRLQYLNNVELDPASLVLYSDSARALLDAILADRLGNKIGGLPGPEQT
jgi:serine/threonine-protein kinase RsbW